MNRSLQCLAVAAALSCMIATDAGARGFTGGGGRGGGGGARPSFSASRPAARPSVPNMSASRPSVSRPSYSAPSVSRPAVSAPAARTSISRPQASLPSGGLKPSVQPSLPTTRPAPGGQLPGAGTRPNVNLPGAGNAIATRPSVPNLGGGSGNRPGVTLPSRPGGGLPGGNLPGAGTRPSPGNVGDFLGMDRPVAPTPLPGIARPGGGQLPGGNLPSRPDIGGPNRPGLGNRPINIGDIHGGNNLVINKRPSWVNIDRDRVTNINNRWQSHLGGIQNWGTRHPERVNYWRGWGEGVRNHWGYYHHHPGWFGPSWWAGHRHGWCGWHYGYYFNHRPWRYWWTVPTFAACVNWFAWSTTPAWSQPVYYDYGQGGNVTYSNNNVYINGQPVATADEFAQSAAALATVPPPASEEQAAQAEWMALGTFAVATSNKDVNPTRVIQLAVDKAGVVSGTLYNIETDKSQSVQGQVDKQTQRVAFRVGESDNVVVETGLYNLTQQEAPVLVHFGTDKVENWVLVRMEEPASEMQ